MKSVLIAYPQMMLGGSTTSLLSLLNEIDTSRYDVSLLLSFAGGPYAGNVPPHVRVLPYAYRYQDAKQRKWHRLLSPRYMMANLASKIVAATHKNHRLGWQYLEEKNVDFYRDVEEEYDVAIAFLEGQMCKYVADHVRAKRKIAWIHIDYKQSRFDPKYDRRSLACFDRIVLVSEECKKSFCECFPELAERAVVVANILSSKYLHTLAGEGAELPGFDADKLNLISTCRLSFSSKGLDRAVLALARLRDEGAPNFDRLVWYILGDGDDRAALLSMIAENKLERSVVPVGMRPNPYPYLAQMSLFFLPSRWEGKPMAVTEAQIMGLPALVTRYASAGEQVRDGVDGRIVDNSEAGVYAGLREILEHPERIAEWRANVAKTVYDNPDEIKRIEALIDGNL